MQDEVGTHSLFRIFISYQEAQFIPQAGFFLVISTLHKALGIKQIREYCFSPASLKLLLPPQRLSQMVGFPSYAAAVLLEALHCRIELLLHLRRILQLRTAIAFEGLLHILEPLPEVAAYIVKGLLCFLGQCLLAKLQQFFGASAHFGLDYGQFLLQVLIVLDFKFSNMSLVLLLQFADDRHILPPQLLNRRLGAFLPCKSLSRPSFPAQGHYYMRQCPYRHCNHGCTNDVDAFFVHPNLFCKYTILILHKDNS